MDIAFDLAHERTRAALDANYLAYSAAMMGSSEHGEYGERKDVALVCCGAPLAQYNIAHLKAPFANPTAALEYAEDFFGRKQFPFSVEIRQQESPEYVAAREHLVSSGYSLVGSPIPGMALAPMLESPPRPKGLIVERVHDADSEPVKESTDADGVDRWKDGLTVAGPSFRLAMSEPTHRSED